MAITIDRLTNIISVPQADWTFVSGTFYTLDTEVFRKSLKVLEASEIGIVFTDTHIRNEPVTVAGTTLAQSIQIITPYTIQFQSGFYTVQLLGSNNNIWSVQDNILIQNQTQIIPTNSAGLVVVTGGAAANVIADAVWDKDISGYAVEGQAGYELKITRLKSALAAALSA